MKNLKKWLALLLLVVMAVTLTACGDKKEEPKAEQPAAKDTTATAPASADPLTDTYGFQWADTTKPILNEQGAKDIAFTVYSSKNASALDYNDMKIMADLYAQTNVQVNWENVSESV